MNFELPEHIRMLRDSLQRFIEQKMPREAAASWDVNNHFPRDVYRQLADLGVMGLTVPEVYGGAGRDILATMIVIEELSKRSMAVSVPYIMCACYAGMNLVDCASQEQKERLLPRVAQGNLIFAYGWTEPDVGADLASVRTTAVRQGNWVIINGAKRFCSGANFADYIYALVKSDDKAARYKNLSMVLIPPTAPGVTVELIDSMGGKGAPTTDVTFSDVRIPLGDVMGGAEGWNQGWDMISGAGLNVEKLEVAAMALGIASAAYSDALEYSRQRVQFGKAISSYQSIRHKLADMRTQLHAARLMLYQAASSVDDVADSRVETSMTKLFVTEAAKTIALECQTIMGAYGYVKGFSAEKYVRDALLMPIIGGSSAVQRNNIVNWSGLPRAD